MSNFSDRILVKLFPTDDDFITITTFDIRHGRSSHFYVSKDDLTKLMANEYALPALDTDIGSYIIMSRKRSSIHFKLTWLSQDSHNEVTGYVHLFEIPVCKIQQVMNGQQVTHIEDTSVRNAQAKLTFTDGSHHMIYRSCKDKLTRNALRKFFRDHFNYGKEERLILYPDQWIGGFYFQSANDRFDGGIARHEGSVIGKDGQAHRKIYYSIHT